ncbi:MAG: class I SAM-dependent methyltransferase [Alcanivorax sp.]|nr:class I SAM-dependent methyltransferase [Alcanivorax sp.]
MSSKSHWEKVYREKASTDVSWFQEHDALSLSMIDQTGLPTSAAIIDVGAGASTLVDDLLARGFGNITVLDLSTAALQAARARLGNNATRVQWLAGDLLDTPLPRHAYDLWHDRAVFHFLTKEQDRHAYVEKVQHAVKPGGLVMVATFAEDGPSHCSGLPVSRYNAGSLHAQFGQAFELLAQQRETHHTPTGKEQKFVYCLCRMKIGKA